MGIMDLSLQIKPVGDTTAREITTASEELRLRLERLPGVDRIAPCQVAAPEGAKGGLASALGSLALSVAPDAIKQALQVVTASLAPRPQTKIVIESKDGKVSFEFDPKRISLQDLVAAAERLRAAPQAP
jgi:hypothetical protein